MKQPISLSLAMCSFLLSGCGGSQYPTSNGGTVVPGITDIRSYLDFTLSISPNGRWLLYATSKQDSHGPHLTLYDLESNNGYPTSYSPEAQVLLDRKVPALMDLRWDRTSSLAAMPAGASQALYLLATHDTDTLQWLVVRSNDGLDLHEPTRRHNVAASVSPENPQQLEFVDSTTRVVALHAPSGGLGATGATVQATALSPSGRYLAYSVSTLKIGTFADPPRLYVIQWPDNTTGPQFLGAPVYKTLHWHPKRDLLFALSRERKGAWRLIQWDLEDS